NKDVLQMVLSSDVEKIRMTLDELDREAFHGAVEAILGAKHIYILGVRSASALANFLGFYFKLLFDNVILVDTAGVSEVFEQILRIGEGDVLIGISFPRYSKRTLTAMKYAKSRGADVVALTDSRLSPLARFAEHTLIAKSDMASFVDSLVAPLSVINALIVAVGMGKKEEIEQTFNTLESIWEEYQVYEKLDDE
ncbi:MAG: MurR/RpiR family transcriptional regulator, partial [Clostridia bacterium]|nr:MurR/RpiR family transcriptional regulator [Clostridia bacterium]